MSIGVASLAIKRPERNADHTPPTNVVVSNERVHTTIPLARLNGVGRQNFALYLTASCPKAKVLAY